MTSPEMKNIIKEAITEMFESKPDLIKNAV